MDIKKPLLVKVEAFIYAFVYSCVGSSATPSTNINRSITPIKKGGRDGTHGESTILVLASRHCQ